MLPLIEALIWTTALSLVMAVIYRLMIKPEDMRKVKEEIEHYKSEMKKAQRGGDQEKTKVFLDKQLKASQRVFGLSMKPMLVSMVIFIVALGWLGTQYAEMVVASPISIPFIGAELNWFWWYLIIIIPTNQLFRKLLGVE